MGVFSAVGACEVDSYTKHNYNPIIGFRVSGLSKRVGSVLSMSPSVRTNE